MALQSYELRISKVKRETKEAISISFEIPDELKEIFKYKPGQFITIKIDINGTITKRAYSISSSPFLNEDLTVTIKEVDFGFVSKYLNDHIKEGDILEVMTPRGKFTVDIIPDSVRHHILFAAGSGITPIMSMIKAVLTQEINSTCTLIYSNRNEKTIIFSEELNDLLKKYSNRFRIIHVLTQPFNSGEFLIGRLNKVGIINLIIDQQNLSKSEFHYYLCGPQGMNNEIELALAELKIEKQFIHKESFNAGADDDKKVKIQLPPQNDDNRILQRNIKIKIYNEVFDIVVEPDDTILTSAMAQGYDPPFSCQIGACATCRAKLISGKVRMDDRDALTDDEIEEGYILTCQSHPITEGVFVDYDDQ